MDLNYDNQTDIIEAFYSASIYLDDLLNIDNPYLNYHYENLPMQ